ncbi:hypothetical protein LSUB1_G007691 [Lachnellula subtilissima]|uniref:Uncharacterized protein n=1 Tax=Lachnellula subtilissima TaxID=602034 RepID=A0A8H8RFL7_9HELO|nr:hypothetical protein LSUB1_G007691 [Lachnellula subtilissima]
MARLTVNAQKGNHSVQADPYRAVPSHQFTAPVPAPSPTAANSLDYWSVVLQLETTLSTQPAIVPYHSSSAFTFTPPYTFNAPQASPVTLLKLHTLPGSSPPVTAGYSPSANLTQYPSSHIAPRINSSFASTAPYTLAATPQIPVNYIYQADLDCDGDTDTEIGFGGSSSTAIFTPRPLGSPCPHNHFQPTNKQSLKRDIRYDLAPLLGAWNSSPVTLANSFALEVESSSSTAPLSRRQSIPDVDSSKGDSSWDSSPVEVEPRLQSDSKNINSFPGQYLQKEEDLSPLFSSPLKAYPRTKRKLGAVQKKTPPTVAQLPTRTEKLKVSSTASKSVANSRLPFHQNSSTGHRNEKGPSRPRKSVASAGKFKNLVTDSVLVVILLVVNLPIPAERLRALEVTGRIKSLYILAFPGYNSPRYILTSLNLVRPSHFLGRLGYIALSAEEGYLIVTRWLLARRQNRPVEHDIFEGLPVRQWRKEYITIAPPPSTETSAAQNDIWAIELPHGMPKDSHLLPQHSQDLLRAARSGKLYGKRTAPAEEEEIDPEITLGEKPEKKEDDTKVQGYTVKTWKQLPRHMEAPDIDYLAKRRTNIKTVTTKQAAAPTLTKATVKRIDATGAEYLQDVVVPNGQEIDGEVVASTTIPDPNAKPLDPYAAPTPSRKKAPINRKRPKGPGRGRKKKPAPTSVPVAVPAVEGIPNSEGVVPGPEVRSFSNECEPTNILEGVKTQPDNGAPPAHNEDVEMGDGSNIASDDEDDEGEEGDDDEGEEFAQGSPAKRQRTSSPALSSLPTMKEIPDLVPSLASPVPSSAKVEKEKPDGSPLKHIAITTSTLTSPIPSPTATAAPPFLDPASAPIPIESAEIPPVDPTNLDTVMQEAVSEMAPTELPPPPPKATVVEEVAAVETRQEEEEEEDMLLDIVDTANNARMGGKVPNAMTEPELPPSEPVATRTPEAPISVPVAAAEPEVSIPAVDVEPAQDKLELESMVAAEAAEPEHEQIEPTKVEDLLVESPKQSGQTSPGAVETQKATSEAPPSPVKVQPEVVPAPEPEKAPETVEDEDDFPDLLGGLEKSLSNPAPTRTSIPVEEPVVAEAVKESGSGGGDADADEDEKKEG